MPAAGAAGALLAAGVAFLRWLAPPAMPASKPRLIPPPPPGGFGRTLRLPPPPLPAPFDGMGGAGGVKDRSGIAPFGGIGGGGGGGGGGADDWVGG